MMQKQNRAVIYARYSSDKQTEQSIEGQLTVCEKYAKDNNLLIINTYIDRAMSGMNDDRPEFQKMLSDSINNGFDYVIVYKLDRFSRSRYDSAVNNRILKKNGVKRISATENISDSPEGVLMESVLEGMAEYYSLELSQKINRGLNENIKKGLMVGGSVTWGYNMIDKKYNINEEVAFFIREIFSLYLKDKTMLDISDYLKLKGIYNVNGKVLSHQHVSKILRNKRYIGIFKYKGQEYSNYIPNIIEEDVFYMVQDKLNVNAKRAKKHNITNTIYLLTGKLFCEECGHTIGGSSSKNRHGTYYYYYLCRTKTCSTKYIDKEYLESTIGNTITNALLDNNFLDDLIESILDVQNKKELNESKEINHANNMLNGINMKITNIVNLIATGVVSDALVNELKSLETRKKDVSDHIVKLDSAKFYYLDYDRILFYFEDIIHRKDYKSIIANFVEKVIVSKNNVSIITKLPGNKNIDFELKELGEQKNPFVKGLV